MQLTEHFSLAELTKSQTALRRGIENIPGPAEIKALTALCQNVLEPVRLHYKRPVVISSGFRSEVVNRLVRGSKTSQHVKGEAADFEVPGVSNLEVAQWMEAKLNYDQLILEFYTPGDPNSGWVHVSWRAKYRNQELTAVRRRGRVEYLSGLVA